MTNSERTQNGKGFFLVQLLPRFMTFHLLDISPSKRILDPRDSIVSCPRHAPSGLRLSLLEWKKQKIIQADEKAVQTFF